MFKSIIRYLKSTNGNSLSRIHICNNCADDDGTLVLLSHLSFQVLEKVFKEKDNGRH